MKNSRLVYSQFFKDLVRSFSYRLRKPYSVTAILVISTYLLITTCFSVQNCNLISEYLCAGIDLTLYSVETIVCIQHRLVRIESFMQRLYNDKSLTF